MSLELQQAKYYIDNIDENVNGVCPFLNTDIDCDLCIFIKIRNCAFKNDDLLKISNEIIIKHRIKKLERLCQTN